MRAITADDIADLLWVICSIRSDDHTSKDEDVERPWRGIATIRWVERWNETNGYWRRGNPIRYHYRWWDDV
jgi:hypothetical protein